MKKFEMKFTKKLNGNQLGIKVNIIFSDKIMSYHVKTHQYGSKHNDSSCSKQIDPKELLVYRMLSYIGLIQESHFFYENSNEFYIATLDICQDLNEKVLSIEDINLNSVNDNKHVERSNLTVESI